MALIAHWPLNGNTNDIGGNLWNGNLMGSPTYTNGKIGQAVSLNGSTQYVDVPTREYLKWRGQEFSVFLWVNLASDDSDGSIISKPWNGSGQYNYRIHNWPDNISVYLLGTTGYSLATPSGSITKDVWNHIGFTVNSTTLKIYINGVKVSEAAHGITSWIPSAGDSIESLCIGTLYPYGMVFNQPTHAAKGLYNDVRIYNHILTDMEVQEIARAKILHYTFDDMQEPTTNLIGGWTSSYLFNAFSGSTVNVTDNIPFSESDYAVTNASKIKITGGTNTTVTARTIVSNADNNGRTFTTSLKIKNIGDKNVRVMNNIGSATTVTPGSFMYITQTNIGAGIGHYMFNIGVSTIGDTIEFIVFEIQSEEKPYATEYTIGSRTGRVNDYSGFFNHSIALTETNTPRWTPEAKIGTGCYLSNADNLGIQTISTNTPNTISQSLWFYPFYLPSEKSGIYQNIINETNDSLNVFMITDHLEWKLIYDDNSSTPRININETHINKNQWNHLVLTYDGTTAKGYINGVLRDTRVANKALKQYSNTKFNLFRDNGGFNTGLFGSIDDVRIYATALSDNDIKDLYETRAEIEESGVLYAKSFLSNVEETTNLIINGNPESIEYYSVSPDTGAGDIITFGLIESDGFINNKSIEFYFQNRVSWGYARHNLFSYAGSGWFDTSKQYTLSMFIKRIGGSGNATVSIRSGNGLHIVSPTLSMDLNESHNWKRFSITFTPSIAGIDPLLFFSGNTGMRFRISGIQLEMKDHPTPFTSTYRPTINLPSNVTFGENEILEQGIASYEYFSTVGIADGLNSFIPLNEPTIRDLSEAGFTPTVSGSPIFKGDYYRFDGISAQINTLNNAVSDWNTPFTLMVSIRIPTEYNRQVTTRTAIIGRGSYAGSVGLTLSSTNSFNFFLRTNSGETSAGLGVFDRDIWYHLVATWDGGTTMRAYRDGVLITESTVTNNKEGVPGGTSWLITPSMAFSSSSGGRLLADIHTVKIFNRALTPEEISIEYNTMFNNEVQIHESGRVYAKGLKQY